MNRIDIIIYVLLSFIFYGSSQRNTFSNWKKMPMSVIGSEDDSFTSL